MEAQLREAKCTSKNKKTSLEIFRCGTRPINCQEDWVETVMTKMDPRKYWLFPPDVNYAVMENDDWHFP